MGVVVDAFVFSARKVKDKEFVVFHDEKFMYPTQISSLSKLNNINRLMIS